MTDSPLTLEFPAVRGRAVPAVCDGGDVTSDAGVLLLTQTDTKLRCLLPHVHHGRGAGHRHLPAHYASWRLK